ncbi:MAG: dienelactone hydrolase family protein [Vicinamibacteria bacterium]|nr:dienelactone hydrolase family protein [Vicinamibacteria bacterium]
MSLHAGRRRVAIISLVVTLAGCAHDRESSGDDAQSLSTALADCKAFVVTGDSRSASGAPWTYASTDDGVAYKMEGVLFLPAGAGPFPGVVLSHGKGGLPSSYSATVGRTMVQWGLAVIAPRYTHAADSDGRNASLLPAGGDGASQANVLRAHKARDLLACAGNVDLARVAAHGHSMGAFVTGELLGSYPSDFRAASHTAGGSTSGPNATRPATAALIRTPYQLHHGDADVVVALASDQALDRILADNGAPHELHVYAGYSHERMATDGLMFSRVQAWYVAHGVLR